MTQLEAVLYIAVVTALVVGGMGLFGQADLATRSAAQMRLLASVVAETRTRIDATDDLATIPSVGDPLLRNASVDEVLIAAGSIPDGFVKSAAPPNRLGWASAVRHEWGGAMNILVGRRDGHLPHMLVYLENLPAKVCIRLSSLTANGESGFVDRVTEIGFQAFDADGAFPGAVLPTPENPLPITPDELATEDHCGRAGDRLNMIYWIPLN